MSDQDELNTADRELEVALKSLTPKASRLDPVAAAYSAGQRSAQRQTHRWKLATAAIVVLGAGSWLTPTMQIWTTQMELGAPVSVAVSAGPKNRYDIGIGRGYRSVAVIAA